MIPSGAVGADSFQTPLTDPDALLDQAEALFADGNAADARASLAAALELAGERSLARVRALGDLAVIEATEGDLAAATGLAARALTIDADYVPALEVLAHCARAAGDLVEAAHWLRRAAESCAEAGPWLDLCELLLERADLSGARLALERAAAIDPGATTALLDELERRERLRSPATAPRPVAGRSALIVVDFFHPSVGGSERVSEDAGVALQELGWTVEVATRLLPERDSLEHRGMKIHQVAADPVAAVAQIVEAGGHDAVLVISDPFSWCTPAGLLLSDGAAHRRGSLHKRAELRGADDEPGGA